MTLTPPGNRESKHLIGTSGAISGDDAVSVSLSLGLLQLLLVTMRISPDMNHLIGRMLAKVGINIKIKE